MLAVNYYVKAYVSKRVVAIQPQPMQGVYISRTNFPALPSFHQKAEVWIFVLTFQIF